MIPVIGASKKSSAPPHASSDTLRIFISCVQGRKNITTYTTIPIKKIPSFFGIRNQLSFPIRNLQLKNYLYRKRFHFCFVISCSKTANLNRGYAVMFQGDSGLISVNFLSMIGSSAELLLLYPIDKNEIPLKL